MPTALQNPQLFLDYLVPAGREKFRLSEVAEIVGYEGAPVSEQSIRNALESGRAFGFQFAFRGDGARSKVQYMTRGDVLQFIAAFRTGKAEDQVQQVLTLTSDWPPEALAILRQHCERLYVRKFNRIAQ